MGGSVSLEALAVNPDVLDEFIGPSEIAIIALGTASGFEFGDRAFELSVTDSPKLGERSRRHDVGFYVVR